MGPMWTDDEVRLVMKAKNLYEWLRHDRCLWSADGAQVKGTQNAHTFQSLYSSYQYRAMTMTVRDWDALRADLLLAAQSVVNEYDDGREDGAEEE